MNDKKHTEDQIIRLWLQRPEHERALKHTEPFTNEVWNIGLKTSLQQHMHYQTVMALIRPFIKGE